MEEISIRICNVKSNDFEIINFTNNASMFSGDADHNDEPIFTGDTIGIEENDSHETGEEIVHKYTGVVLFDAGLFYVDLIDSDSTTWHYGDELDLVISHCDNIYVLGNIFQDNDILEILQSKRERKPLKSIMKRIIVINWIIWKLN
jgi:hypothetical protein